MNKRTFANFIIFSVCLSVGLAACGGNSGEGTSSSASSDVSQIPQDGLDLIDADYTAGRIDYETSLLYKVQYIFGDSSLPQKYITTTTPYNGGGVFFEVQKNYSKLSDQTKTALAPYLARPDNEESYLDKLYFDSSTTTSSLSLIKSAYAETTGSRPASGIFGSVTTADNLIKISYPEWLPDGSIDSTTQEKYKATAQQLANDLYSAGAYSDLQTLITKTNGSAPSGLDGTLGGDDKLDIYLIFSKYKTFNFNTNGVTIVDQDPSLAPFGSSFILLRIDLTSNEMATAAVHQLFLAFLNASYGPESGEAWWREATATWGEHYVFPTINSEQRCLDSILSYPELSLSDTRGNHECGAYLFPFYLVQKDGEASFKSILAATYSSTYDSVVKALSENLGTLRGIYDEFALWNYNSEPITSSSGYHDGGGFPTDKSSLWADSTKSYHPTKGSLTIDIPALEPLSSVLAVVSTQSLVPEAKKILFKDLKNYTSQTYGSVLKAIIYPETGGPFISDWSTGDWSTGTGALPSSVTFNLSTAGEDLDYIVLLFANSNIDEKTTKTQITVEVKESSEYSLSYDDKRTTTCTLPVKECPKLQTQGNCYSAEECNCWSPCLPVFSVSGDLEEDGVDTSCQDKYPYMGKWRLSWTYTRPCSSEQLGAESGKGTITFDLSNYCSSDMSSLTFTPIFITREEEVINYVTSIGDGVVNDFKTNSFSFEAATLTLEDVQDESATIVLNFYPRIKEVTGGVCDVLEHNMDTPTELVIVKEDK